MMADAMIQMHAHHKANLNRYQDNNNISFNNNNYAGNFNNNNIKSHHHHQRNNSLSKVDSNPSIMSSENGGRYYGGGSVKRGGSFIVGQKLRESKWFKHDEIKIVCAVVESGFIIEKRDVKSGEEGSNSNNNDEGSFGVVVWVAGYEKSKDPHYLTIYTLVGPREKLKVQAFNLSEFWTEGSDIRINNKNDKTNSPNVDEAVRRQIKCAERRKFHNSEHFAYFCRYEKPDLARTKKITEIKWSASSILAKFRSFSVK